MLQNSDPRRHFQIAQTAHALCENSDGIPAGHFRVFSEPEIAPAFAMGLLSAG